MDQLHYKEMAGNLNELIQENVLQNKKVFLFGHCNATEELANLLLEAGHPVAAILDNNIAKQGRDYRGIRIEAPQEILSEQQENTLVCIAARAYAAMAEQLRRIGYKGQVRKLVDYDSYADYSLSEETVARMRTRVEQGRIHLNKLNSKYPGHFRFLCPFAALGDIYLMMSYLPYFMQKRNIGQCVIGVIGNACAQVVQLFGAYNVEVFSQKDMDETIQAVLYTQDSNTFIPHQDRPYVVNLHKALYVKPISLEQIYCCGVFGLPANTKAVKPREFREYSEIAHIRKGKAVILSPYAKSVTNLSVEIWEQIVDGYIKKGYQCFTNVAGEEKALKNTLPISPAISEMKSVVERAGVFIGIRSGMCDVLREAKAEKIALYPNYNYCDTNWKAIDIYGLEGWKNIVVKDDFKWKRS